MTHLDNKCDCIYAPYDDMNIRDVHRERNIPPFDYCSPLNETQVACLYDHYK